jgi:ABC-2 type transport system permease protein
MRELIVLLKPRYWAFRRDRSGKSSRNRHAQWLFMGTIGLAFWAGAFSVFYRILGYFQGVEEFGDILAYKLLAMILLTFFSLLIFSGIITSLAKLFLSRDLIFVHSLPLPPAKIFLARFVESTIDSSWMVVVYSLPVLRMPIWRPSFSS